MRESGGNGIALIAPREDDCQHSGTVAPAAAHGGSPITGPHCEARPPVSHPAPPRRVPPAHWQHPPIRHDRTALIAVGGRRVHIRRHLAARSNNRESVGSDVGIRPGMPTARRSHGAW